MPELASALETATRLLESVGVPSPRVDAELLAAHVLGVDRGGVQAKVATGTVLGVDDLLTLTELVERRAAREPLQHIVGTAAFRRLELAVGPGVFVPRPETEIVAQFAIDTLLAIPGVPLAVDLGTGSGAIALSLATEVAHARVWGVEVSPLAYVWTRRNFRGVPNATPVFIDLADALPELDGTVDVVISNPPYVPLGAVPRDPEVRLYDPEIALYGGDDGMDVVRTVSTTARRLLRPGGTLVLEHGEWQAATIAALLAADGFTAIAHHRDLTGRDRATTATR